MEQYVRDARIAQIYEGTNGVQAMDLVGRKLALEEGAVVQSFFEIVRSDIEAGVGSPHAALIGSATKNALSLLSEATKTIRAAGPNAAGSVAVDYQRLFALVAIGWMWTRMAAAAVDDSVPMQVAKRAVATFFAERILPQAQGLAISIEAGVESTATLPTELF